MLRRDGAQPEKTESYSNVKAALTDCGCAAGGVGGQWTGTTRECANCTTCVRWFPAWFDPAADGREVFHHTRPATARGMVWAHVERRDMVAAFDWKPSAAGRYKVPPAIKRWVTG